MKVAVFDAKPYDRQYLVAQNASLRHELTFIDSHLNATTASLAVGFEAVCAFVNDEINQECIKKLAARGVKAIALRCAGFNNVDVNEATARGITVVRVPEYSPHGVAEHAVTLILALNRKIYRAYNRVRENNFLLDGLLGFNLNTKTVGVIGVGKIGSVFCKIMQGFGCRILAYDPYQDTIHHREGIEFTAMETLLKNADIISLHCPLTPNTHHIIDTKAISSMKDGVMLINTSRGALIDTLAVIKQLKTGKIGYLGMDVYEEEGDLFFEDISNKILEDDVFARLLTFPNVLLTGHQAFFTSDALTNIAATTLQNLTDIENQKTCVNAVLPDLIQAS